MKLGDFSRFLRCRQIDYYQYQFFHLFRIHSSSLRHIPAIIVPPTAACIFFNTNRNKLYHYTSHSSQAYNTSRNDYFQSDQRLFPFFSSHPSPPLSSDSPFKQSRSDATYFSDLDLLVTSRIRIPEPKTRTPLTTRLCRLRRRRSRRWTRGHSS